MCPPYMWTIPILMIVCLSIAVPLILFWDDITTSQAIKSITKKPKKKQRKYRIVMRGTY